MSFEGASDPIDRPTSGGAVGLSPTAAELLGWLLTGLYQAVAMAGRDAGFVVQAYALGQMALAGALVVATGSLWRRLGKESPWARVALFGLLVAPLVRVGLETDLDGPMGRLFPAAVGAATWVLAVLLASLLALTRELIWRFCNRGWWRLVPLLLAAALGLGHGWMPPAAYPGVHLLASASVALVTGAALYGLPVPVGAVPPPSLRRGVLAVLALLGVTSVIVPPENAELLGLQRQPGAVWASVWAPTWARFRRRSHGAVPKSEWLVQRSTLVPPSAAVPPEDDRIVVLLGIDSMRAVILEDESLRKDLPELFRLRDRGTWFRQARSPGASTATAIAPMFASKPYSALYWTMHPERLAVFPHEDETPRFTEVLRAAEIPTFTVDTTGWLNGKFGLVRGFSEEVDGRRKTKSQGPSSYPSAKRAAGFLLDRIEAHGDGPLFAYVHFMDAHSPYTSAGPAETPYASYLKELGLVDRELGKLRRRLDEQGLARRTIWVVYADHGEAFGEHGLVWHASTLYDPMIRVPFLVSGPGIARHTVDEPVSLLDVYPTVLDLFGLPTPGHALGQTLVPLLAGERDYRLTRPIVAEARLKRALVSHDLLKVVHDPRSGGLEVYDLRRDPAEEHNLYDEAKQAAPLFDLMDAYFAAHELERPGYETPFRKW